MYQFNGRFVYLEQLTSNNDKELFDLMKNYEKEYRYYVSDQPIPDSYEEFLPILKSYFEHGRNYQFLVYRKSDKKLIGTIFFYNWTDEDNSTKISAFFIPEVRKTPLIFEALGAALLFAVDVMKVNELKFDCYKENEIMINLAKKIGAKKIGAKEIGQSKSKVNPERELINFSITLELMESLKEKIINFEQKRRTRLK